MWGKVVGSDPKKHFLETTAKLGFKYVKDDGDVVDVLAGQNSGILIASKYPIEDHSIKIWRVLSDNAYGTAKGALKVKLDINGTHAQLICLHLDAHMADTRKKQILEVAEMIDSAYPTIIAGDFNINSKAPAPNEFTLMLDALDEKFNEGFLKPAFDDLTQQPRTFNRFFDWSLDHVLFTKEWQVVEKRVEMIKDENNEDISDHYGVYLIFEIDKVGSGSGSGASSSPRSSRRTSSSSESPRPIPTTSPAM